jgi:hypothetical protein
VSDALLIREHVSGLGWITGDEGGGARSFSLSDPRLYQTGDLVQDSSSTVLFAGAPWFALGLVAGEYSGSYLVIAPGYKPAVERTPERRWYPRIGKEDRMPEEIVLLEPLEDPRAELQRCAALLARPKLTTLEAQSLGELKYEKNNRPLSIRFSARERRLVADYLASAATRVPESPPAAGE